MKERKSLQLKFLLVWGKSKMRNGLGLDQLTLYRMPEGVNGRHK